MYLTRFQFNTARRSARALLASPQRTHAAVLSSFPGDPTSRDDTGIPGGRVLWRVDQHPHQVLLYLVSPDRPDLTHLVEQAGWPTTQAWETRKYAPLLDRLATHDRWGFRLVANPVRNRRGTDGGRGKRSGHITVAQQTAWLLRQAERGGFRVPEGALGEPDVAVHRRDVLTFTRQGQQVTLTTATFEGQLEILDPDALRARLIGGIGPAKGYGCGLLTLAPLG
jgi:CRISPR system Cascade subunit CasE